MNNIDLLGLILGLLGISMGALIGWFIVQKINAHFNKEDIKNNE